MESTTAVKLFRCLQIVIGVVTAAVRPCRCLEVVLVQVWAPGPLQCGQVHVPRDRVRAFCEQVLAASPHDVTSGDGPIPAVPMQGSVVAPTPCEAPAILSPMAWVPPAGRWHVLHVGVVTAGTCGLGRHEQTQDPPSQCHLFQGRAPLMWRSLVPPGPFAIEQPPPTGESPIRPRAAHGVIAARAGAVAARPKSHDRAPRTPVSRSFLCRGPPAPLAAKVAAKDHQRNQAQQDLRKHRRRSWWWSRTDKSRKLA